MPETTGSAMKAKIHARVACGDRRLMSSDTQASTTHTTYDATKISNQGISIMRRSIKWRHARYPNRTPMGRRYRPAARRLHPPAGQVAALRPRLEAARPPRGRHRPGAYLGRAPGDQGDEARGDSPRRPHPRAFLRRARHRRARADRRLLRPPRQAARDDRMAFGHGTVDAGDR